jgi:uncharacterized protein involved in response to NO
MQGQPSLMPGASLHASVLDASAPPEPYRLFFPLGIVLGLLGVSVWPLYALGLGIAPSAGGHVGLQIQGFVLAFSLGFLLTALPKFLGSPPVRLRSQVALALAVVVSAAGFWTDRPVLGEGGFVAALLGLAAVMAGRFRGRSASPPEPFVAVLLGLGAGMAGGLIKLGIALHIVDPGLMVLGRRLLSEGMILLFVIGIGGKLGPLLLGYSTRTPNARWTHGTAALLVLGSIVAQYGFGLEAAAWVRAIAVVAVSALNVRFWRLPVVRSALTWGVFLAHWMLMAGLVLSAALPQYRVEALHLVFVGGFSILILAIAMRVVLAHGGYPLEWEQRSWPLRIGIALFVVAALARAGARFAENSYLEHLGLAGVLWMSGLVVWGAVLVKRIAVRARPSGGLSPLAPLAAARVARLSAEDSAGSGPEHC